MEAQNSNHWTTKELPSCTFEINVHSGGEVPGMASDEQHINYYRETHGSLLTADTTAEKKMF